MSIFSSGTTKKGHHCTLIYWGTVQEMVTNEIRHKEHENIILIWKSIEGIKGEANIS